MPSDGLRVRRSVPAWLVLALAALAGMFRGSAVRSDDAVVARSAEWVTLRSDTLQLYSIGRGHIFEPDSRRYAALELANGSKLAMDRQTPEGRYELSDGTSVELRRPAGAPPQVRYFTRPVRVLPFVLRTSRRAGLVVQAIGDTAWRADSTIFREYLESPLRWLGGEYEAWKHTGERRSEISPDWCTNGHVPMPDTTNGLARIVWLTFDTEAGEASPALRAAARRLALLDSGAVLTASIPDLPTKAEALRGQVVASVIVDLASGRVLQRRGRVQ